MRLVTFENSARQSRIGTLAGNDGRIIDLNSAFALYLKDRENESAFQRIADALVPPNMRALFEGGDTSLDVARKALKHALDHGNSATGVRGEPISHAPSEIRLKAPIIPKKFFHTAGNFREHHEEATKAGFSHPVMPWIVFFQNVDAIIGHDEPVIYPEHLTHELDYELELTVVLKKSGKHFTPEDAASYIGGYVIFNDITARDIQRREMKSGVFSFCKAIDTFCPLGPWIVTADEIPDPHNLAMQLRVNGQSRQNSHSSKMSVKIPEILSHYSPMGYSAGDVVSTGTVSGVAAFSGDPKALYLKPGDVMECEIEKIGILRNPVISWETAYGQKPAALATQEANK
jgi:2-keto-4-pentenoate hydratase/2-oxohepta-3-ene-1,7-dioic acid hydratase in catechol pathway